MPTEPRRGSTFSLCLSLSLSLSRSPRRSLRRDPLTRHEIATINATRTPPADTPSNRLDVGPVHDNQSEIAVRRNPLNRSEGRTNNIWSQLEITVPSMQQFRQRNRGCQASAPSLAPSPSCRREGGRAARESQMRHRTNLFCLPNERTNERK